MPARSVISMSFPTSCRKCGNLSGQQTLGARDACMSVRTEASGRRVVQIDGERFLDTAPALQKFLAAECIREAAGAQQDIEAVHIDALAALFKKQTGKSLNTFPTA